MHQIHCCLIAVWLASTLQLFAAVAFQYGVMPDEPVNLETETSSMVPSTSPAPVSLPTPGMAYAFMNYIDYMLASIANSSWPNEVPFVSCSSANHCLPNEKCYRSLGCGRGICADLTSPEFQKVINVSPSTSTDVVSPTAARARYVRSTRSSTSTTQRIRRFKTSIIPLDSNNYNNYYHLARKAKRLNGPPPPGGNYYEPFRLNYYGMKCETGDDCANVGRRPYGVPCIRNGTEDVYFCLCPPQSFFYRESYCKLYEYGDACTNDYQCNTLFLMQKRLSCRSKRCECADSYTPVSVSLVRAAWGPDLLPDWLDNSLAPRDSVQTYCLSTDKGAFYNEVPAGYNCTIDILGSPSPRICAANLTCLFCAGDVNEGTCVQFPLYPPTPTPKPNGSQTLATIFVLPITLTLTPALLIIAIFAPFFLHQS